MEISGELKMTKRLQGIFNIYPGEGRMVALVLAYAILLFFSNVLALTASLGLFFETYDAATLPYTYVLLMFVGPLASLVYLRLNNRFQPLQSAAEHTRFSALFPDPAAAAVELVNSPLTAILLAGLFRSELHPDARIVLESTWPAIIICARASACFPS